MGLPIKFSAALNFFFLKSPLRSRRRPRPATSGPAAGSRCGCEGWSFLLPPLIGHGVGCRPASPDSRCSGEPIARTELRPRLLSLGAGQGPRGRRLTGSSGRAASPRGSAGRAEADPVPPARSRCRTRALPGARGRGGQAAAPGGRRTRLATAAAGRRGGRSRLVRFGP